MSPTTYHILHVSSLLVLFGYTFYAFAAPAETRKRVLIITGIASLLVLIGGFGLITKLRVGFPGWIIVKIVCWVISMKPSMRMLNWLRASWTLC